MNTFAVCVFLVLGFACVQGKITTINLVFTPFDKSIQWTVDLDYPVTCKDAFNFAVHVDPILRNKVSRYPSRPDSAWHWTFIPFQVPRRYENPDTRVPKGTTEILITYDPHYELAEYLNHLSEEELRTLGSHVPLS